jgi:hypothetical protein
MSDSVLSLLRATLSRFGKKALERFSVKKAKTLATLHPLTKKAVLRTT